MKDWTGEDAVADAQNAGSWFKERKQPNIIERLKKLYQKMKQQKTDQPPKAPKDNESAEEVITKAAQYLRTKKGDLAQATDQELAGALDYVMAGTPADLGSDTFLSSATKENTEKTPEVGPDQGTFLGATVPSDSLQGQLTQIRPPKSNEKNPDPRHVKAAEQGLMQDPQGNIVDKNMTPMRWNEQTQQWEPDPTKKPVYGSQYK